MKILYIDCFSGISGDMFLGALLDLGLDIDVLRSELSKLAIEGYSISHEKAVVENITGSRFKVDIVEDSTERTYENIRGMIESSGLEKSVKDLSTKIFKDLAEVEGKIHGKDPESVHFHEIGAVDSILDIVGASVGIKAMGIDRAYASKIHVGEGFVECRHGLLPVPVPATLELIKNLPVYSTGIQGELVTPTGAVILKNICTDYGQMPEMVIEETGYGAGTKYMGIPNMLRIISGEIRS